MAALEKFTAEQLSYKLRHNTRECKNPSNKDIDSERTHLNYHLTPESHGRTAKEAKAYFNKRMREVYHIDRKDLKAGCQWICTAPEDLAAEQMDDFFKETYRFMCDLYGEENIIQAVTNFDEGVKDADGNVVVGRPHMHVIFIPVVENKKYMQPNKQGNITRSAQYKEKVCADQLITKKHLQSFHPAYQKWLSDHGIRCTVHSGITGGKNKTVAELKSIPIELTLAREQIKTLEAENAELKEKITSLEAALAKEKEKETTVSGWGKTSGWGSKGKEREKTWDL